VARAHAVAVKMVPRPVAVARVHRILRTVMAAVPRRLNHALCNGACGGVRVWKAARATRPAAGAEGAAIIAAGRVLLKSCSRWAAGGELAVKANWLH